MSNILQASDITIKIAISVNGEIPSSLSHVTYVLYNRSGVVLEKTLQSAGVSYLAGELSIKLFDTETINLQGAYTHSCIARTSDGVDFFPLTDKPLTVLKTVPRIQQ